MTESASRPAAYFDVDGTVFKSSLLEKITDACVRRGVFSEKAFLPTKKTRERWQRHNSEGIYTAYLHQLVGTFVGQIRGVGVSEFEQAVQEVVADHRVRRFCFPLRLMDTISTTHNIVAISGSPEMAVRPFLQDLPISHIYGSQYEVEDDHFTGKATSVGDKAGIRSRLIKEGIVMSDADIGIGDTMGDASLLREVAFPIVFNASATLSDYAGVFRWPQVLEVKDNCVVLMPGKEGYSMGSAEGLLTEAGLLVK